MGHYLDSLDSARVKSTPCVRAPVPHLRPHAQPLLFQRIRTVKNRHATSHQRSPLSLRRPLERGRAAVRIGPVGWWVREHARTARESLRLPPMRTPT